MNITFYSAKHYDQEVFTRVNEDFGYQLSFVEPQLNAHSVELSSESTVVCAFVNDVLDQEVLRRLSEQGVGLLALRCAGFDNVDLEAAKHYKIQVVRVGAYSPHAVAEHALGLMLALNRHLIEANARVHQSNFAIDGLLGFDFAGKTMGVIGTGKIGAIVARITQAMGMEVLAYDPIKNPACEQAGIKYVDFDTLLSQADVVSLHCPLNEHTHHLIDAQALEKMQSSAMLINTSRGGIIDTCALVAALESAQIGYVGLDVYENEQGVFFEDLSCTGMQDSLLKKLLSFDNVLLTAHQGFFTQNALENIATTTFKNIQLFAQNKPLLKDSCLNP